jgi:hypothetical protein
MWKGRQRKGEKGKEIKAELLFIIASSPSAHQM